MAERFTKNAETALNMSLKLACEMGHSYIGSEHILLALMKIKGGITEKLLESKGITALMFSEKLCEIMGNGIPCDLTPSDMTPKARKIIEASSPISLFYGYKEIGCEHIFMAILEEKDCVARHILEMLKVSIVDVRSSLELYITSFSKSSNDKKENNKDSVIKKGNSLLTYGTNLTELAENGELDIISGRIEETERVIQILCRKNKNNPCLIGEPGVGKTAVVEGLAARIAAGDIPDILKGISIISVDISKILAGAKYRGEFEERFKNLISDAERSDLCVLFIDEIHMIVGAGAAEGALDAANIIKPALARGKLKLIGATTLEEYRRHIEKDSALERRFQTVYLKEPTKNEAIDILKSLRKKYEEHHKIIISDGAINAAVELSQRYIYDRFLPDKAIDLIDEGASALKIGECMQNTSSDIGKKILELRSKKNLAIKNNDIVLASSIKDEIEKLEEEQKRSILPISRNETLVLNENHIAKLITRQTGIPISRLMCDEKERLSSLSDELKSHVIGQDAAIESLVYAIKRGRMGLGDPTRPIASFIFAGESGVGKTKLSYALAECMFDSEENLIRLDMSEYMEKHSISKLIGSPPGYIGYDSGGKLTEKVRRRPYSIILLDEIEKAHIDVLNTFLQVLDDGILTDSTGRQVNFKNTVIIMTTNIGYDKSMQKMGFDGTQSSRRELDVKRVIEKLEAYFKSEFINRVDEIIVFDPLSIIDLEKILRKMMNEVIIRIRDSGVDIDIDESVIEYLMSKNKSTSYGARELSRIVRNYFEKKYIEEYFKGNISLNDNITAKVIDDNIIFLKN